MKANLHKVIANGQLAYPPSKRIRSNKLMYNAVTGETQKTKKRGDVKHESLEGVIQLV